MPDQPHYEPMTAIERRAALSLAGVTFPVASYDKRFARSMIFEAKRGDDAMITAKQRRCLWNKIHRYRRQIDDKELVGKAWEMIQDNHDNEDAP